MQDHKRDYYCSRDSYYNDVSPIRIFRKGKWLENLILSYHNFNISNVPGYANLVNSNVKVSSEIVKTLFDIGDNIISYNCFSHISRLERLHC